MTVDTQVVAPLELSNDSARGISDRVSQWISSNTLGPPGRTLRLKFFLTGCLFPAACAAYVPFVSSPPTIDVPWQSGRQEHFMAMLLSWPCEIIFLPLISYSILSLTAWLLFPKSRRWLLVRLGVYAGVPLAGQYLYFIITTSFVITLICAAIVGPLLALLVFLIGFFLKRVRRFSIQHLLFFMTFVASACGILQMTDSWTRLLEAPLLIAAATPTLNLMTYVRAAIMLAACPNVECETPRSSLLGWFIALSTLAATWSASWKIAIDVMLAEYAKLPTTDPNCYLSAAARHRHVWLFRECAIGVSLQTKRLKFLEIALRCAAPRFHGALRRFYDRIGPPLAGFCGKSAWFADCTYLALLPLEWAAQLVRRWTGISTHSIDELYSDKK